MQQLPKGHLLERLLLLAHLGRCHHLHRAGDLRGTADGFDAPAYIPGWAHNSRVDLPLDACHIVEITSAAPSNRFATCLTQGLSFPSRSSSLSA
jgi:hypothetical protein